jgi:glycine/D-amino acid oxidase-like deaminating enzyme
MENERFDVVVIGGGQAGLATGYHLAERGLEFVILCSPRPNKMGFLEWRSRRSLGTTP